MFNDTGFDKFISTSNDTITEEIKLPFENQNENNSYFLKDDICSEQKYFIDSFFNKLSTRELSNNLIDNKIEKNNSNKEFEGNFPFIRDTKELKESKESKINKFHTKIYKKRGRTKLINSKRKTHSKDDRDNILTKIQNHFLTFLINVSNDVIKLCFHAKKNNKRFRQIDYNIKKNITKEHITKLKTCSIKDILQMKISPKYKKCGEDYNKEVYNFIYEEANKDKNLDWINNFFDMKYLEAFKEYYYNCDKNMNYFFIQDKTINFSFNTKPFYNLLEKYPEIQNRLKDISKRNFLG